MTNSRSIRTPAEPRISRPSAPAPLAVAPRYTIATLVTDPAQYAAMRTSFCAGGFDETVAEYIFIDNTGPDQTDAYRGLNALLNAARAPHVILCHQDVRLLSDGRDCLDERLRDLSEHDPAWALAGNAGGAAPGKLALRISDPHGRNQHVGALPARVASLDENFLVVRRACRIGFSTDLAGFHFYGADICLHAAMMGFSAYVIDFHLEHLSPGKKDQSFFAAERAFRQKWSRALAPRLLQTTCSLVPLTGGRLSHAASGLLARPLAGIMRRWRMLREPHATGKAMF